MITDGSFEAERTDAIPRQYYSKNELRDLAHMAMQLGTRCKQGLRGQEISIHLVMHKPADAVGDNYFLSADNALSICHVESKKPDNVIRETASGYIVDGTDICIAVYKYWIQYARNGVSCNTNCPDHTSINVDCRTCVPADMYSVSLSCGSYSLLELLTYIYRQSFLLPDLIAAFVNGNGDRHNVVLFNLLWGLSPIKPCLMHVKDENDQHYVFVRLGNVDVTGVICSVLPTCCVRYCTPEQFKRICSENAQYATAYRRCLEFNVKVRGTAPSNTILLEDYLSVITIASKKIAVVSAV